MTPFTPPPPPSPPLFRAEILPRLKAEAWTSGDTIHALVRVLGKAECHTWAVSHSEGTQVWTCSEEKLPLEAFADQPEEALIRCQRGPATSTDLKKYGITPASDTPLIIRSIIHAIEDAVRPDRKSMAFLQTVGRIHRPGHQLRMPGDANRYAKGSTASLHAIADHQKLGLRETDGDHAAFYPTEEIDTDLDPRSNLLPHQAMALRKFSRPGSFVGDTLKERHKQKLKDLALAPFVKLRSRLHQEAVDILGPLSWSMDAYVFYAADGITGDRRRQAGRLYKALSHLIACDPATAAAVDAERPFEAHLYHALKRTLAEHVRPGLTPALLRRFRAFPPTDDGHKVGTLLEAATKLPIDWVPGTAPEWEAFASVVLPLRHLVSTFQLDLPTLLKAAKGKWSDFQAPLYKALVEDTDHQSLEGLVAGFADDALDPPRHCLRTLIGPLLSSLTGHGWDELPAELQREAERIAADLVFGGLGIAAVDHATRIWHKRSALIVGDLPRAEGLESWPALFDPITTPDGLTLVPLTTPAQLAAEGMDGPDPDGIPGLDHCVGTYAVDCLMGASHIVSVRRLHPDGSFERLSTAELTVSQENGTGLRPTLRLVQNMGLGNSTPPKEIQKAIAWLRDEYEIHRHVPLNPEALARRDVPHDLEVYDWADNANLEKAFTAWKRCLTRSAVRSGLDGLRERLQEACLSIAPDLLDRAPAMRR